MLPLLNWTFHFISVGRSKGIDHFIFIVLNINLPSEIFMYPRGTVDSDDYGPDNNLVLLTTSKKSKLEANAVVFLQCTSCSVVGGGSELVHLPLNPGRGLSVMACFS